MKGIASFTDPVVRKFIKRANKGGRVIAKRQQFRTQNIKQIMEIYGCETLDQLVNAKLTPEQQ